MNARRTARGFFAAISCSLASLAFLAACSNEVEAEPTLCERLQGCGVVEGSSGLERCTEQLAAAGNEARSCEACLDGASCPDVKADACKKPCLGVIEAVGGEPPPVSRPGSSGGGNDDPPPPPPPPPAEVLALCDTLDACQIRPPRGVTCEGLYLRGLAAGTVNFVELERCDQCLQSYACDVVTCRLACNRVL